MQNLPIEMYGRRKRTQDAAISGLTDCRPAPPAGCPKTRFFDPVDASCGVLVLAAIPHIVSCSILFLVFGRSPRAQTPVPAYIRPNAAFLRRTIHYPMRQTGASPRQRARTMRFTSKNNLAPRPQKAPYIKGRHSDLTRGRREDGDIHIARVKSL